MTLELDSREQTLSAVKEGWGALILLRSIMYGLTIRYPVPKLSMHQNHGGGQGVSYTTHCWDQPWSF